MSSSLYLSIRNSALPCLIDLCCRKLSPHVKTRSISVLWASGTVRKLNGVLWGKKSLINPPTDSVCSFQKTTNHEHRALDVKLKDTPCWIRRSDHSSAEPIDVQAFAIHVEWHLQGRCLHDDSAGGSTRSLSVGTRSSSPSDCLPSSRAFVVVVLCGRPSHQLSGRCRCVARGCQRIAEALCHAVQREQLRCEHFGQYDRQQHVGRPTVVPFLFPRASRQWWWWLDERHAEGVCMDQLCASADRIGIFWW
jgi:hypothetical protein